MFSASTTSSVRDGNNSERDSSTKSSKTTLTAITEERNEGVNEKEEDNEGDSEEEDNGEEERDEGGDEEVEDNNSPTKASILSSISSHYTFQPLPSNRSSNKNSFHSIPVEQKNNSVNGSSVNSRKTTESRTTNLDDI